MRDKSYKFRLMLVFGILVLFVLLLEGRLYLLQVPQHTYYTGKAINQQKKVVKLTPRRGDIVDRNGHVLATSRFMDSVYVEPQNIPSSKKKLLARELAKILELQYEYVSGILSKQGCFPLARKIGKDKVNQLQNLKMEHTLEKYALYFLKENKRIYPRKNFCASVLGFTTIDNTGDNRGLTGIERQYNEYLKGKGKKVTVHQSATQEHLEPIQEDALMETIGHTVVLTIDSTIQGITERELAAMIEKQEADGGAAVAMDVKTGEIIALVSLPAFDPNEYTKYPKETHRNRAITGPIETGSVMKMITFSTLIDRNLVKLDEIVDCQNGYAVIDGRIWSDAGGHVLERVPIEDVFVWSSNVGTVKLSKKLEVPEFHTYLIRFGLGQKTGVDLPIEDKGILRPPDQWKDGSRASVAVGYEIGVTPIQIATVLATLANGGVKIKPHIVKEIRTSVGEAIEKREPETLGQVVKKSTAHILLEFMEEAVNRGTGRCTAIEGYRIGGKTGTTKKTDKEKEFISSFAGIFPLNDPKIAFYLYVDNPRKKHFGAEVAAPVFRNVAEQTLRYMGIPPSESLPLDIADTATPDMKVAVDTQERSDPVDGHMPDLKGLTMREVRDRITKYNFPVVQFVGSGRVIDQKPETNLQIDGTERCLIFFN